MKQKSFRILDLAQLALAIAFAVGAFTFLKPCAAHDDGSWMSCHWAGEAVKGMACLLALLGTLKLCLRGSGAKLGLALATVPAAILTCLIPGGLIGLCMMDTMRCQVVSKPGTLVFGVLIAALAVVDAVLLSRADKR